MLPIAPLLFAVNPLLTLTVSCKFGNFLRSGFFFFFFKYYPVLRSLCSADFNRKCACSLSPMFKSWTTLTTSKTFPASLLEIKIKKCQVGKFSWLTKIHKYYLFLQNYLYINLIDFFSVKEIGGCVVKM